MDPVSLITAALATGAAAAAKETAGKAVREAYEGLKSLVRRKLRDRPDADEMLERNEREPGGESEAVLKEALQGSVAGEDDEVVAAARRTVELADPEGVASGKYQLHVGGDVQGLVQGDHAQVNMTFGDVPKSE
ncbi:MAG TPA: hypothetical protein VNA57_11005 [Acidimicrobiales bacterium]|nr:hypothetical protein [Acidimicrobiales bacterium]